MDFFQFLILKILYFRFRHLIPVIETAGSGSGSHYPPIKCEGLVGYRSVYIPQDVGMYELVADKMRAGERVVGVAEQGVGRVP